jgi:hypothetical protein
MLLRAKGLFTRTVIFVSHHVARRRATGDTLIGLLLILCDIKTNVIGSVNGPEGRAGGVSVVGCSFSFLFYLRRVYIHETQFHVVRHLSTQSGLILTLAARGKFFKTSIGANSRVGANSAKCHSCVGASSPRRRENPF